jgi:mannose-1-phosphate guanylyltransferase
MIRGIVMAGGSGKRLWPLSRENKPKQLLSLFSDKTLLQEAVSRIEPVVDSVSISAGKNLENQLKEIFPKTNLIIEPERRDNAAAIGLCTIGFGVEDILVFVPSDSYIDPNEEFQKNIKQAISIAEKENAVVVIGVKPTFPSTGFGYIEPMQGGRVKSFREKPAKEVAEKYVKEGYLWNISVFVSRASVMIDLFKRHSPQIYSNLMKIKSGSLVNEIYPKMEKISIDFAIMEKAEKVFYVPASFYWNDIGGFNAITQITKKDNVVLNGELIELNSKGNLVHASTKEKVVALIDCEDLVVIDTLDALLVCPKSKSEIVKKLVEEKVSKELL